MIAFWVYLRYNEQANGSFSHPKHFLLDYPHIFSYIENPKEGGFYAGEV